MIISRQEYSKITASFRCSSSSLHSCLKKGHSAIYSGWVLEQVRKKYHSWTRASSQLWSDYSRSGSIQATATKFNIPECIACRIILSLHFPHSQTSSITKMMRNPAHELAELPQLRAMVQEAIAVDLQFSPSAEESKRLAGEACEREISNWLASLPTPIPFCEENDLRENGLAKTPDFVLEVPIAVQFSPETSGWRTINWIESKASFGSEYMHRRVLTEQLHSYHNRYGPGLVIYWGGYVNEVRQVDKSVIVSDSLPSQVQTITSVYLSDLQ